MGAIAKINRIVTGCFGKPRMSKAELRVIALEQEVEDLRGKVRMTSYRAGRATASARSCRVGHSGLMGQHLLGLQCQGLLSELVIAKQAAAEDAQLISRVVQESIQAQQHLAAALAVPSSESTTSPEAELADYISRAASSTSSDGPGPLPSCTPKVQDITPK